MAERMVAKTESAAALTGRKVVKARRKQKVRISTGTWIFIVILVAAFSIWNFYVLPRMGQTATPVTPPQVFQIAQHKNPDVVKAQLKTRQSFLTVTPRPIPSDTGKNNPFE